MVTVQVFESSHPGDFYSTRYLNTYRAWIETWAEEYARLGAGKVLHSDKFTRQDQILAVFVDEKCAALSCFNEIDLSTEMGRADSWFEGWPDEVIVRLCKDNSKVLVWSALTVSKAFRGQRADGISISKILSAACVDYFTNQTHGTLMVGSTRNNRGINSIVSPFGAQTLKTVEINSEPTDLVYFKRGQIPHFSLEITGLLKRAWVFRPDSSARKAG